jgi:hypothetical protein
MTGAIMFPTLIVLGIALAGIAKRSKDDPSHRRTQIAWIGNELECH